MHELAQPMCTGVQEAACAALVGLTAGNVSNQARAVKVHASGAVLAAAVAHPTADMKLLASTFLKQLQSDTGGTEQPLIYNVASLGKSRKFGPEA